MEILEPRATVVLDSSKVTFSQVRGFVTVASTGSFTRAAEVLHLSQPALTTRIRQLEEGLELRLFDRNPRSVDLTEVGRQLLPVFLRVVNEMEAAVINARDHAAQASRTVRLACLPSCAATLLPDLIREFRASHPGAVFQVEDAIDARVRDLVRQGKVDFGVCVEQGDDPDLMFETLFQDNLQAVYPPGHALETEARLTLRELIQHPLILTSPGSSIRAMVDRAFAAYGMAVTPACEASYMSTAVALVRAGLGVAILPSTAVETRALDVRARAIDDAALVRNVALVRHRSSALSRIAAAFAQTVTADFARL